MTDNVKKFFEVNSDAGICYEALGYCHANKEDAEARLGGVKNGVIKIWPRGDEEGKFQTLPEGVQSKIIEAVVKEGKLQGEYEKAEPFEKETKYQEWLNAKNELRSLLVEHNKALFDEVEEEGKDKVDATMKVVAEEKQSPTGEDTNQQPVTEVIPPIETGTEEVKNDVVENTGNTEDKKDNTPSA